VRPPLVRELHQATVGVEGFRDDAMRAGEATAAGGRSSSDGVRPERLLLRFEEFTAAA
jgi:hypothetical protein